jgi:hypothetical protein
MSDKIEREIEEILSRLDEPGRGEDMPDRAPGLFRPWTTNAHRASVSRLAHISRHQIMLASLVLAVLVGAGLFFGLIYPSLSNAGSDDGRVLSESTGDQTGQGAQGGEVWSEGSADEGTHAGGEENEHEADHSSEDHTEHHRGGGEH